MGLAINHHSNSGIQNLKSKIMMASFQLISTPDQLTAICPPLAGQRAIGVDTETTSLDPLVARVRLLQLSTPEMVYILDLFQIPPSVLAPIKEILEAERPVKVLHNAKFDAKMLRHHFGIELNALFDTMLASQLVSAGDANQRHGLSDLVSRYLGQHIEKTWRASDWSGPLSEAMLEYAAEDAAVLLPLRHHLIEKIKESQLINVAKLEFDCVLPTAAMELAGIFLDQVGWAKLVEEFQARCGQLETEVKQALAAASPQVDLFGQADINLNSPQQVQDALARLGIPIHSTRELELESLTADHPIVAQLIAYKHAQKFLSMYGRLPEHIHPVTGRIHADFRQIGTPTGRFSCSNPNVQQVPNEPEVRACFKAPPGKQLVVADYSQIELCILAEFSRDPKMLDAFLHGVDLHRSTASLMFDVPLDEITKERRAVAKCLVGDVLVTTARGLVPLKNVVVGDVVATDHSWRPVTAKLMNGVQPVHQILTDRGTRLVGTPDHKVRIIDETGDCTWRELGQLRPGDAVVVRRLGSIGGFSVIPPLNQQEARTNHKSLLLPPTLTPEFARWLGLMVSEGSVSRARPYRTPYGRVALGLGKIDPDVLIECERLGRILFGGRLSRTDQSRSVHFSMGRVDVGDFLATHIGAGAAQKQVPEFVLTAPLELKAEFLRGLYEGDGTFKKCYHVISYATTSRKLAEQVKLLLRDFGIESSIRIEKRKIYRHNTCYHVVFQSKQDLHIFRERIGFLAARKQQLLQEVDTTGMKRESALLANQVERLRRLQRKTSLGGVAREKLREMTREHKTVSLTPDRLEWLLTDESLRSDPDWKFLPWCYENRLSTEYVIESGLAGEAEVFDITVQGDHVFLANGVVVHNCTNYGLMYGMGAAGLATQIGTSVTEAEKLIARYFDIYRGVADWLRAAADTAVSVGHSRTHWGRWWRFHFDPHDREQVATVQRLGKNMPIQGTQADMLKRAMRLVYDALKGRDAQIVNSIHDELVVETDQAIAEEVAELVRERMIAAAQEFIRTIPVEVDVAVGDAWMK